MKYNEIHKLHFLLHHERCGVGRSHDMQSPFAVNEIVWEFYIHLEAMRNPASILKSLGVDGEILKT